MDELKTLESVFSEFYEVADKLKGLESMLDVFYHSMILNPDTDIWQNDKDKYIDMLSEPYITIIGNIKTAISEFNDIHNRMDNAISALGKVVEEGR